MQQKYIIYRDSDTHTLKIQEYAVLERNPKKGVSLLPEKGRFTLLYEESYESDQVLSAISRGVTSLIAYLRTHHFFPIEPNAIQIAESVIALYNSSHQDSVELFFNDIVLATD